MDKKSKAIIGVGVIAATAYLISMNKTGEESFGGGNFGGLGGGGLESIEGVTDSGTPYNISFPAVDPTPIIKLIDQPVSSGTSGGDSDLITTVTEKVSTPTTTKKSALSQDRIEQSGSFTTSLAQVFGAENQKTNVRGDYYTTPAGGGAGAIKGKSIGEMVTGFLSQSYKASKTEAAMLPTGASTAVDPKYSISADAIAALQAEQANKAQLQETIEKFKIATYSSPSGVKETLQTTKKEATTQKATVSLQEAASRRYDDVVSKSSSSSSRSVGSSTTSSTPTKKKVISLQQAKTVRRD
jgi:hypothetical protein